MKLSKTFKEHFIKDLTRLIRIPSVLKTFDEVASSPFGIDIQSVLELMLEIGLRDGFRIENIDNYAGVIEMGEGEEIGILGHLDVVPVQDGWSVGPFSGEIKDGRMYGRGVND